MDYSQAIEIENLSVAYEGKPVFTSFDLSVEAGEKVVLTGDSGCGKSTVLRAILGFVVPTCGNIRIEGQNLNEHNVWAIRRKVAYVAQEPELGTGRTRSVLSKPFDYHANAPFKKNLERLPELMKRFRLSDALLEKNVSALSGGEKQRFALVSAILLDRKIFLLDEFTSALDSRNFDAVTGFFEERNDLTVVAVSHERNCLGFTNRTVKITNGISEGQN